MAQVVYATDTDLDNLAVSPDYLVGISPAQITAALGAASAKIDSYLRSQYTLPLLQYGLDITQCCCDLAAYWLMARRGYNPEAPLDRAVRQRYEDAILWLKDVQDGGTVPDITSSDSGATEGSQTNGAPEVVSSTQRGWSNRPNTNSPAGGPAWDFQGD